MSERNPAWSRASSQEAENLSGSFVWAHWSGLLLPLLSCAALLAAVVHFAGPFADAGYTVLRPVEVLRDVYSRSYVPSVLLCSFLIGRLAKGRRSFAQVWLLLRERLHVPVRLPQFVGAAISASVALSLDRWCFPEHCIADHLVLVVVICWLWAFRPAANALCYRRAVVETGTTVFAFLLVSYVFTVFKASLFVGSAPQDDLLFEWERYLWGVPSHRRIAEWASAHPGIVALSDAAYYRLFEHMTAVSVFLLGLGRSGVRQRYFSALVVCYLLGGVAYHVVPSWGPAFFERATFSFLDEQPLITSHFRRILLGNTLAVQRGDLQVMPSYEFLAAMPSLHIAHECVMLYYSRSSIVALVLGSCFTLVTLAAVLVLGWHYPVDIVGGGLLAMVAISVVEKVGERWYPSASQV